MILTVEILILLVIMGIQLFLAVAAMWVMRNITSSFSAPLGSQVNVAELLEKYNRVVHQVNIKVNATVHRFPAKALPSILHVDRDSVFELSLFHNYFTLFQIILTRQEHTVIHKAEKYQIGMLLIQLLFLLLSLIVTPLFAIAGSVVGAVLLLSSYFLENYLRRVSNEAQDLAIDLLDLDPVEKEMALELSEKMRAEVFSYPIKLIIVVVRFLVPFLD